MMCSPHTLHFAFSRGNPGISSLGMAICTSLDLQDLRFGNFPEKLSISFFSSLSCFERSFSSTATRTAFPVKVSTKVAANFPKSMNLRFRCPSETPGDCLYGIGPAPVDLHIDNQVAVMLVGIQCRVPVILQWSVVSRGQFPHRRGHGILLPF